MEVAVKAIIIEELAVMFVEVAEYSVQPERLEVWLAVLAESVSQLAWTKL